MLTVGQLAQHLNTLDPNLPIGVTDIDRHPGSQRATINLRSLADLDVVHDPRTGEARAVWLTAQPITGQPDRRDVCTPRTVVLPSHPCGCLLPIPIPIAVASGRSINLDAFACPHHQPNALVVRSARSASE